MEFRLSSVKNHVLANQFPLSSVKNHGLAKIFNIVRVDVDGLICSQITVLESEIDFKYEK
ncbi:hypothetical protein SADUNF_Sadunf16G0109600 [Salix dunnii]|uniref:Uncharacterized protein n=1 Tax=Salix dunnii TaxID=1413687 RepID=A0A835J993_9ROSI|nr:hypothetical protein SADUNF_Sadunf16G0109600 [Salix dunnii]